MPEKKEVLIICHTTAGQMYLGILMNRIWFSPVLVSTPHEGIHISQQINFSLIILDGDLPSPERNTAVTLLRSDPALKELPLIVFLTDDHSESTKTLLSQGCDAVIRKPLDLAIVYEALARLTGQPRTTQRIPIKLRVELAEAKPEKVLTSVNISEGGIYLRTLDPLSEGTRIHIKFTLPHDTYAIAVNAEVVRSLSLGVRFQMEPGMGLHFIDVPDDTLLRIRNFIQWEMTGDLEWKVDI